MNLFNVCLITLVSINAVLCGDWFGTTPHIRDIFVGRCWDYQLVKQPDLLNENTSRDCDELWDTFSSAFTYKGPCDVTFTDYQPFMKATEQKLQQDKSAFWSGIYEEAQEYADDGWRYLTLEETFLGYLVNGLTWCGQVNDPGINYNDCPTWGSCSQDATEAFWGSASKQFAEEANGVVRLLLNGSNPDRPAFSENSFFASYELPNLNPEVVSRILIFVLHDFDIPQRENCTSGSLLTLKNLIQETGMKYQCYDNPRDIVHMLCIDESTSKECKLVQSKQRNRLSKV